MNHESLSLPSSKSYLRLLSFCGNTKPPTYQNTQRQLGTVAPPRTSVVTAGAQQRLDITQQVPEPSRSVFTSFLKKWAVQDQDLMSFP